MFSWITSLFDTTGFPARWHCGAAWKEQPGWGWTTIVADLLIWAAYMAIPIVLLWLVKQRRDVPFPRIFGLFGAFILACGTTHLIEALIFWWPAYRLSAVVKLATAGVSLATVVAMLKVMPVALSLRGPEEQEYEVRRRTMELERVTAQLRAEAHAREEAERTLRESEERLRMALRAGRMGTWDWDIKADEARLNTTEFDLLNVERDTRAIPIEALFRQVHPDDEDRMRDAVQRAIAERGEINEEFRIVRGDNDVRWLAGRAEVVCDSRNHPVRLVGVNYDVTERVESGLRLQAEMEARRQMQKSLERSEEWLKMVLRAGRMGTWDWDIRFKTAILDAQELELLGRDMPPGSHPDRVFFDSVHPEDRVDLNAALERSLQEKAEYDAEFRIVRPDGETRWLAARGDVICDAAGRPQRMVGVNFDVTQQKHTEKALLDSANFLRRVLDSLFVFAGVCTPDGTLIEANRALLDAAGIRPEHVLGQPFPKTWWWSHDETAQAEVERAVTRAAEGETCRYDTEIRVSRDERLPIDFQLVPMWNDEGRITHLVPSGIDISQRKEFERSLEIARQQANAANRAKSEFLANMSHEIRTPLTGILGGADALYTRLTNEDHREIVHLIRSQGRLLLGLLNDILDLSKIEAGRLEIQPEPTSIKVVVEDVRSLLGPQAFEKGLSLEAEFEGRLPVRIETDPLRVRQILLNLVGNAVKFTERGSVRVAVRCDASHDPAEIVLSVKDTGVGIPREQYDAIFEAFTQQHPEITRRYGGTGLGLTICQRLVHMLSGQITLSSQVGEGTEFVVHLPVGDPSGLELVEADALPETPRQDEAGAITHVPCRVLVVEDNRGLQFMLRRMLEEAVDSVSLAPNGDEAIREIHRAEEAGEPYHVVLMDMHMPVLNGFDATARLRAEGCGVPIIALTAGAMSGDRARCLEAGCDDYLSKPVDRDRMLALIQEHYERTVARGTST